MNKYGYEVIVCSRLDKQFIDSINISRYSDRRTKLAIQVTNTKHIDKSSLLYLKNLKDKYNIDLKISVVGPHLTKDNDSEIKKERYFYNTLYDLEELYKIIGEFEKIESSIDPQWNKFDIVTYLSEIITRNIMYDPEYFLMANKGVQIPKVIGEQDKSDYYDRSLRGVLTRKSVCAGFAIIFKELANRNGIDCKYVSGAAYSVDGVYRGGHAWNLIRIDGVIYPLDITWKNTKYRMGDFGNIDDISCDIDTFKKRHRPYDEKDNVGLTKLPEDIIKKSKEKILVRKHYNATTYTFTRKNGTKFILSQIGMYKGMYRYLYSEISTDGSYNFPQIFFSDSNFVKEFEKNKFEENDHYDEFLSSFVNVLFSKENLNDSRINKNTKYIGRCELSNKNGYVKDVSEIVKSDRAINTFNMKNIRSQKRNDGSILTLVQFPNNSKNNLTYVYYVYVLSKGPIVMEYRIYSNDDYFSMQPSLVVNSILSDNNLQDSLKNKGIMQGKRGY